MTLLSNKPASVAAGTNNTLTINKTQLVNLINNSGDVNAAYYADESNWKRVIFYYQDSSKKQKTVVMFDTDSNTGRFKPSRKSKYNKWQLRRIVIEDKDNGIFALSRTISSATTALNQQEIEVISPNVAPTGIMLAGAVNNAFTMQEGSTFVSNLAAVDENMNDAHTFSIVAGQDSAYFEIIGNNALHFKAPADFESGKTSYTVTIKVSDSEGLETLETFTVNVTDVDEAPPLESFVASTSEIKEFNAKNQTVAVLAAIDPDGLGSFTFSLVSGQGDSDNSYFYIEGNKLKANTSFVYGSKNSYSVRIRVTDSGNNSTEKVFSFSLVENYVASGRFLLNLSDSFKATSAVESGTTNMSSGFCVPSRKITTNGNFLSNGLKIYQKYSDVINGSSKLNEIDRIDPSFAGNHALSPDGNFLIAKTSSDFRLYERRGKFFVDDSFSGESPVFLHSSGFNFSPDSKFLCFTGSNWVYLYKKTDYGEFNNSIWKLHQSFQFTSASGAAETVEILSDHTLLLGIPSRTVGATTSAGIVQGFYWDSVSEKYITGGFTIENPNVQTGSNFGKRICGVDSSTVIVTAPATSTFGRVYIFKKNAASQTWQSVQTLSIGATVINSFGCELSNYRNNRIAISSNSTTVKVFKNTNTEVNPFVFEADLSSSISSNSQVVITDDSVLCDPQKNYPLSSSSITTTSNAATNLFIKTNNNWATDSIFISDNSFFRYGGYVFSWDKQNNTIKEQDIFKSSLGTGDLQNLRFAAGSFINGANNLSAHDIPNKNYLFLSYVVQSNGKFNLFKNTETDRLLPPYWQAEFTSNNFAGTYKHFQINDEGTVFSFVKTPSVLDSFGDVIEIYEKINNIWTLSKTVKYSDFGLVSASSRYFTQLVMNKTGDTIAFATVNTSSLVPRVVKKINDVWTQLSITGLQSNISGQQASPVLFDTDDYLIFNTLSSYSSANRLASGGLHVYRFISSSQLQFVQHLSGTDSYNTPYYFDSLKINKDRNKMFCVRKDYTHNETDKTPIFVFVKKNGLWQKIIDIKGIYKNGSSFHRVGSVTIDSTGSNVMFSYTKQSSITASTPRYMTTIEITNQVENQYVEQEGVFYLSANSTRVALNADGTTMAVGVPGQTLSGAVNIYIKNANNQWTIQQTLAGSAGSLSIFNFGQSVALSSDGNTLAVGAPGSNGSRGIVFIYKRTGNTWAQTSYLAYTINSIYAAFGSSVSLNAAGDKLAVGAPTGGTYAANGNQRNGMVYLYTYSSSSNVWQQAATYEEMPHWRSGSTSERFGEIVSLSSSGNILVIYNQNYPVDRFSSVTSRPGYLRVIKLDTNQQATIYQNESTAEQYTFSSFQIFSDQKILLTSGLTNNISSSGIIPYVYNSSTSTWSFQAAQKIMLPHYGLATTQILNLQAPLVKLDVNGTFSDSTIFVSQDETFARRDHVLYKKINGTWIVYDLIHPDEYSTQGGYYTHSQDGNIVAMSAGRFVIVFKKT